LATGDVDRAREPLRVVTKRDPHDVDSLVELAEATELEAPAEALAAYEAAISLMRERQVCALRCLHDCQKTVVSVSVSSDCQLRCCGGRELSIGT
jgi:hypothetical protein